MNTDDQIEQEAYDYLYKNEAHLPVEFFKKMERLLQLCVRQKARIAALAPPRENPDWLHERNQQGGPSVPQKFVQGSWVDA